MPMCPPGSPEVDSLSHTRRISRFGYTCQVHLALEVYRQVFRVALPWIWFATNFNAVENVESSNPAQIYLRLSTAVQTGDVGSKLIRGYRASMLEAAFGNPSLEDEISRAAIECFRPQIWLLDLELVANRKGLMVSMVLDECRKNAEAEVAKNPGQVLQHDEYLLKDLQDGEYALVADG